MFDRFWAIYPNSTKTDKKKNAVVVPFYGETVLGQMQAEYKIIEYWYKGPTEHTEHRGCPVWIRENTAMQKRARSVNQ